MAAFAEQRGVCIVASPTQANRMKHKPPKDSGHERTLVLRPKPPTSMGAEAKIGLTSSRRLKMNATIMYVPNASTTCSTIALLRGTIYLIPLALKQRVARPPQACERRNILS